MSRVCGHRAAGRGGYTLLELSIGLGIGAFVLAALSTYAFFVMNFFRTINAETLMPVAAREIRDHLCFSLDDANGKPVGRGLLAYTRDGIEIYDLGLKNASSGRQPKAMSRVHLPIEGEFVTGWNGLATNVPHAVALQTLQFRATGVMNGGVTNRVTFPYCLTPAGAATEPAVVDSFNGAGVRDVQRSGEDRGAVL